MPDKGVCQIHKVEFILTEGCPLCLAEKKGLEPISEGELKALVPKVESGLDVPGEYEEALKLKDYAERRVITSTEDIKVATDDLTIIARLKKSMAERKKELLQPHQDKVKAINDSYKLWMEPVLTADSITREKILAFNREQDRIRREQEEVNRLRMEAAQKEAELKGGELSESVNLVEVTPEVKRVSTDMGTTGMVDNWKYEVVDFSALPDEYKVPDTAMLNSIAKKHHDQKQIPGVRFYNKPTLRVNAK